MTTINETGAMVPVWPSWVPERSAFIRVLDSADVSTAYPDWPEVSTIPLGMFVAVLHDATGLPLVVYSGFREAVREAAMRGLVVARVSIEGHAAAAAREMREMEGRRGDSPRSSDRL